MRLGAGSVDVSRPAMERVADHLNINIVRSEALFVSALQPSDEAGPAQVRDAVTCAVRAHGSRGCAERVAQEFGDHPEIAVARMRWARCLVDAVFAGSPPGVTATGGLARRPVAHSAHAA
jgi:hypothetical protein